RAAPALPRGAPLRVRRRAPRACWGGAPPPVGGGGGGPPYPLPALDRADKTGNCRGRSSGRRFMTEPLVAAAGLTRHFAARGVFRRGKPVQAVNDVTLSVGRGQSVGLVGESGSGKSTVGRVMLGLLPPTAGPRPLCRTR